MKTQRKKIKKSKQLIFFELKNCGFFFCDKHQKIVDFQKPNTIYSGDMQDEIPHLVRT